LILLDTSGMLAAFDGTEAAHERVAPALRASPTPRLISPLALAELDYLLAKRVTLDYRMDVLDELKGGAYRLAPFAHSDLVYARDIMAAFRDLDVGLTDASIVAIALREGVRDVLTLDERHFRILPGPGGKPFRILPADA
jgi:predicted nucleic acid-binding protein